MPLRAHNHTYKCLKPICRRYTHFTWAVDWAVDWAVYAFYTNQIVFFSFFSLFLFSFRFRMKWKLVREFQHSFHRWLAIQIRFQQQQIRMQNHHRLQLEWVSSINSHTPKEYRITDRWIEMKCEIISWERVRQKPTHVNKMCKWKYKQWKLKLIFWSETFASFYY